MAAQSEDTLAKADLACRLIVMSECRRKDRLLFPGFYMRTAQGRYGGRSDKSVYAQGGGRTADEDTSSMLSLDRRTSKRRGTAEELSISQSKSESDHLHPGPTPSQTLPLR